MGRRCAVGGCGSGRTSQKIKYSLFKAPAKPDLLEKWSAAIGRELSSKHYVCELHFDATDIIRQDRRVLSDGNVFVSDRCKVTVKRGAIPELNVNQCSVDDDCDDLTMEGHSPDDFGIDTHEDNASSIHPVVNKVERGDINENDFLRDAIVNYPVSLNDAGGYEDRRCANEVSSHVDWSSQSPLGADVVLSPSVEDDATEVRNGRAHQLSVADICDALKAKPLPSNWSWMLHQTQVIILSCLDPVRWRVKCHVKIKNDMTVVMVNAYIDVSIEMEESISDVDMIWDILSMANRYHFCIGTGYDEKKCSLDCRGMTLHNDYKKTMPQYRCIPCRKERQAIQNHSNYKRKDYKDCGIVKKVPWC